ncbi:WXG100 family type VII secretion target [Streptomyces sp. P9-A2]|uniref:WXG100 family type VII secretion target n=1 Tax=Streptomyces sp. P9-A2 TaxID=3072284 RepID=UPI002FC58BBB
MSGEENKPDLHQEERREALAQNKMLDAVTNMTSLVVSPLGSVRGIHFGSTSFENYDLNQMIDIVESANPELLESAGTALVDARDAIQKAADELKDNLLGDIDWKGESQTAFTKWATSLVRTAEGIADYAEVVGTQVMAAGSGLASVRKSMPPRDNRTDPKLVKEIPEAKQVESNDEYTAAVKAEDHRQEAINQMYRLASFYTVSAGTMAKEEEPVFPKMPDAGVPPPSGGDRVDPPREREVPGLPGIGDSATVDRESVNSPAGRSQSTGGLAPAAKETVDPVVRPDRRVGTEINSVGVLPPQEALKPATATPPATAGPVGQQGPIPPIATRVVPPAFRGTAGRTTGPSGVPAVKSPPPAQGRAGGAAGNGPAARTGPGPVGQNPRAAMPGPVGSRGNGPLGQVGRTAVPGQSGSHGTGPVGRGVVGGVPKPTGPVPGQVGGFPRGPVSAMGASPASRSGPGRSSDGIVGGRPVMGAAPGGNGSKLPRGTVIGGEGASGPRVTGQRTGQHGVIGTPPTTSNTGRASRRSVGSSDGVVGMPNGRVSGTRNSGRPSEGSGAQRGATGNRSSGADRSRRDERRSDTSATD